jgi:hypothetical protein
VKWSISAVRRLGRHQFSPLHSQMACGSGAPHQSAPYSQMRVHEKGEKVSVRVCAAESDKISGPRQQYFCTCVATGCFCSVRDLYICLFFNIISGRAGNIIARMWQKSFVNICARERERRTDTREKRSRRQCFMNNETLLNNRNL